MNRKDTKTPRKPRASRDRLNSSTPERVKLQQTVLEQFRKNKITIRQGAESDSVPNPTGCRIRQGAELLGLTYLEMNELLKENHIPLVSDVAGALRRRRFSKARRATSRRTR